MLIAAFSVPRHSVTKSATGWSMLRMVPRWMQMPTSTLTMLFETEAIDRRVEAFQPFQYASSSASPRP